MRLIELKHPEYILIEEVLAVDPEETALEPVAGIDCDDQDVETQREKGDADPIVTVELIAQWSPEGKQGILDWFFVRESGMGGDEPTIEHGGPLCGFAYEGDDPDFDRLLPEAVAQLNVELDWIEFELGDLEEDED